MGPVGDGRPFGHKQVSLSAAWTRRPGQVALDLPVDLPRTGVDPDELRRSPEYTRLRSEVGRAVKAAAA